jgi:SpoIIAA-like
MIEQLVGFADNVVAFRCLGRVTKPDYRSVLVPAVTEALRRQRKVRLYYETGPDFSLDPGAAWEHFKVGVESTTRWEHIAVVTDVGWIKYAVQPFGFLMPGATNLSRRSIPGVESQTATCPCRSPKTPNCRCGSLRQIPLDGFASWSSVPVASKPRTPRASDVVYHISDRLETLEISSGNPNPRHCRGYTAGHNRLRETTGEPLLAPPGISWRTGRQPTGAYGGQLGLRRAAMSNQSRLENLD